MESKVLRADPSAEYDTPEGCYILELSNSDADESLSVARARVEPGRTTRLHRLRRTAERYVILSGEGRVRVGTVLSETVGPGNVVLIPADTDQQIINTGTEDLVFLALCTPRYIDANYRDTDTADTEQK